MKLYMNIPLKNKYNIMIPICRQYDLEVKGVVSGAKDLGIDQSWIHGEGVHGCKFLPPEETLSKRSPSCQRNFSQMEPLKTDV